MHLHNAQETPKLRLKRRLDVFTHCLVQNMNAFNMQLKMHKSCFDILNIKTLNTEICNYLNNKKILEM